jgi:hypothetical protein
MKSTQRSDHRFLTLFALPVALLAWAMAPDLPHDLAGPGPPQCIAALSPDTARIQTEPVVIGYLVPDSIGTIVTVAAEDGSGLVVGRLDSEARTVALETQSATAGRWSLTFEGDSSRICGGTLNVIGVTARS